ncbi:MAG: proline--tRNA ligase [Candidatus Omnitrophica bacterium]|nr:proline--tRNA ligase [Candidatus Omnitrophota bacterium]
MFWSKSFIPTLKEVPQEAESAAHQLMLRAGLVRMLMAGVYSYLPLGWKVLNNIQGIIRRQMEAAGAVELLLPALQPQELWVRSGRDKDMGQVMIRFSDRRGRKICLGPTHEEVVTELIKAHVFSYKQMPLVLYQIQTKFRDEIRPRFGVVRACEFIMKDAYSFDKDQQGLETNYKAMHDAYNRIFAKCGLNILTTEADSGVMGGRVSHEFMAPAESGEDLVETCPKCRFARTFKEGQKGVCPGCNTPLDKVNTIELGHIFQLGTKYSEALGATFLDAEGLRKPIIMGCYGIGVSRLIAAIIEQNHDDAGIIWPRQISPYKALILPLEADRDEVLRAALDIYRELEGLGIESILDDRDERPGVKFKDADLLGITLQVIIGKKTIQDNTVELKLRRDSQKFIVPKTEACKKIKELLSG